MSDLAVTAMQLASPVAFKPAFAFSDIVFGCIMHDNSMTDGHTTSDKTLCHGYAALHQWRRFNTPSNFKSKPSCRLKQYCKYSPWCVAALNQQWQLNAPLGFLESLLA